MSRSADYPSFVTYILDKDGIKTDSLLIESEDRNRVLYIFQNIKGNIITQISPGELLEITNSLKIVKKVFLKPAIDFNFKSKTDINEDGNEEYFFSDYSSKELYLFTDNFKWSVKLPLESPEFYITEPKIISKNRFYFNADSYYFIYSFKMNPFYWFRLPLYLFIYLAGVLFFHVILKSNENRLRRQYELRDQVRELQLKSFRSQLDPHFVFNTFNAIASVIKKGENETAYKTFMHFSKLIRQTLSNINNDYVSLKEELQTVTNFIELQKVRFRDLFHYEINCRDEALKEQNIPRMIIQVHVENAIKHGLRPRKEGGLLSVRIGKEAERMHIEITDNGIGREASKNLRTHSTGIGTKTMDAFIEHLNKTNKQKIVQEVEDLYDDTGNALGTKVVLLIPFGL